MINPIFKMTNPVAKIERMKFIMIDMVEFMNNYDFFEDEDLKADDVINAIKNEEKIVRSYVVDKIVCEAYDCDYLVNEGFVFEEAMAIAKYLIMKREE